MELDSSSTPLHLLHSSTPSPLLYPSSTQVCKLREFPRFVPPKPNGIGGVVWEDGIGPGCRWEEQTEESTTSTDNKQQLPAATPFTCRPSRQPTV